MTKYCKGCGVLLQNEDENALGYVPTLDASYCQRCYRIRHYGDVTINMQQGIESNATLEKINKIIFKYKKYLKININILSHSLLKSSMKFRETSPKAMCSLL